MGKITYIFVCFLMLLGVGTCLVKQYLKTFTYLPVNSKWQTVFANIIWL